MTRARKHLVCLSDTPYYHVSSRCVRRAFLCGVDRHTGQSYEHRRGWIEDRVRVLATLFSIELCAYAVMSNHYHLVVKLNPVESETWSDDEVLDRWTSLYRGPLLVQQYLAGGSLTAAEQDTLRSMTALFRARLASLSWFMKCLNEPIARKANAEDDCTGHFWEARFHSQSLCSRRALLAAMAYVDLNPVRAGIATTLEESDYTGIKARLEAGRRTEAITRAVHRLVASGELNHWRLDSRPLMRFAESTTEAHTGFETGRPLPLYEREYLKLVDATGRLIVRGKTGSIDPTLPTVLDRLGFAPDTWLSASTNFRQHYRNGHLRLKQSA